MYITCTCTMYMYNVHVQCTMNTYMYMYMYSICHLIFKKGLFHKLNTQLYTGSWRNDIIFVHKHWNQLLSTTYLQHDVQGVDYVDIHVLIISYITTGLWHLNLAMFWEYNMNLLTIQHGTMEMSNSYVRRQQEENNNYTIEY